MYAEPTPPWPAELPSASPTLGSGGSPGYDLPALTTVLQRPWELTRKDLRELRLALDQRGISETTLAAAEQAVWRRAGWPAAQLQAADLAGMMPPRFVPTPDGGTMTV